MSCLRIAPKEESMPKAWKYGDDVNTDVIVLGRSVYPGLSLRSVS